MDIKEDPCWDEHWVLYVSDELLGFTLYFHFLMFIFLRRERQTVSGGGEEEEGEGETETGSKL